MKSIYSNLESYTLLFESRDSTIIFKTISVSVIFSYQYIILVTVIVAKESPSGPVKY